MYCKKVALVSHDAGGAELLASYINQSQLTCRLVLEGPAVSVFSRRFGLVQTCALQEALSSSEWCLCGTSGQADLEWLAIAKAKETGMRVVSFLDHWMNYPERFTRNGIQHLPDEIWVGDKDAEKLAKIHFPNILIRFVRNPYFIDIKKEIKALEGGNRKLDISGKLVLFVSENISGHPHLKHLDDGYVQYDEFDAIDYFLENMNALGERIKSVVIRPHPSDPPNKYERTVEKYSDIVKISNEKTLLEDIVASDIVVGCQSMAMVVGLLARKKVVSCIPPMGHDCCLPQENIVRLRELVEQKLSASIFFN
ncbi:polysialyltransferase family glycosyltransferase [Propionivibrio sp.]|uniref:polysialyltransferase family glycosyltransferase n=1 Tax=Propionivibrio sp. TaxID=2212460 RepID=UPI00260FBD96|nr:polysialyltransferase family glycosyltransferase [Propionivibrio sp.]